ILAMVIGGIPILKSFILTDDAPLFFVTDSCIILGSLLVAFRAIWHEDKGYFSIGTLTHGSKDEVGLTWEQIWSCQAADYLSNFYFMTTVGFWEFKEVWGSIVTFGGNPYMKETCELFTPWRHIGKVFLNIYFSNKFASCVGLKACEERPLSNSLHEGIIEWAALELSEAHHFDDSPCHVEDTITWSTNYRAKDPLVWVDMGDGNMFFQLYVQKYSVVTGKEAILHSAGDRDDMTMMTPWQFRIIVTPIDVMMELIDKRGKKALCEELGAVDMCLGDACCEDLKESKGRQKDVQ
ncbi:hypothetical protein KI387_025553, partial [Taxus chinensis]